MRLHTFTGRKFDLANPRAEDVCLEDIAHALSQLCRFGGHTREFYSVAQHSVAVSDRCWVGVGDAGQRYGLLHDASEAYLVDLPTPLKQLDLMMGYRLLERKVQRVVLEAFGLDPARVPPLVAVADREVAYAEMRDLMLGADVELSERATALGFATVVPVDSAAAERMFLDRARLCFSNIIVSHGD